ncbi:hypothetical protein AHAS_Ahas10G0091600 [Arachis hypogaea]
MESDSEDSSEFSGQWTNGWSTRSEDDECERIRTESGQPEKVNMTSLDTEKTSRVADDAKAQESSPSMVRSNVEPNSSNRFVAGVTVEDLALAEFDSVEEAHARYVEYARITGFAIRKGDSEKDKEGNIVRKFFFCNREGLRDKKHFERIDRQRAHKPITRTNCNASYLKGKTELDPLAVVQYTYCAENHLGNLFWCDGQMQHDYDCFGDVLAFNSTYRKNLYNRPSMIFLGTNHHRQTIIFVFGLLEDEKIPSYKWLLWCFLDVIRQKEPMVVVTDGDESMKKAIQNEFPNATH